jgi:hypothetical protein
METGIRDFQIPTRLKHVSTFKNQTSEGTKKKTKHITKQMTTPFQSKQIPMGRTWSFTRIVHKNYFSLQLHFLKS